MNIAKDTAVTIAYKVTTPEGKPLDSGTLSYLHGGYDNIFPKVEAALDGQAAGFATTLDLAAEDAFGARDEAYSASLRSGDISLIYFSGHGVENAGHNYFIPRDFGAQFSGAITRQVLQDRAIVITPYIDDLTRERVRLHLLVLDACRSDLEGQPRGLAGCAGNPTQTKLLHTFTWPSKRGS